MSRFWTVFSLGLSQLICWGISYYLIGVFGDLILADLGWSRSLVFGGFSAALLVMGLVSPLTGRLIDSMGGGRIMALGSILCAMGCVALALAQTVTVYYGAWICLGLAMRATLYDAAFATLSRIFGRSARQPMSEITLLGGLASTCFWPIGHLLSNMFGWRGALLVYAGFALATLPLHLALPTNRHEDASPPVHKTSPSGPAIVGSRLILAASLYALIITLVNGLNAGMSAHMISMLMELGVAAPLAISVSSLRGIGQSLARLAEVLSRSRLHPVDLNLLATLGLPVCFMIGLAAGGYLVAAAAFPFFYGASNGILSITRGTLPLVLFDIRTYGAFVGKLLVPSFAVSALAPLAYAALIEHSGASFGLYLSILLSLMALAAAGALKMLTGRQ